MTNVTQIIQMLLKDLEISRAIDAELDSQVKVVLAQNVEWQLVAALNPIVLRQLYGLIEWAKEYWLEDASFFNAPYWSVNKKLKKAHQQRNRGHEVRLVRAAWREVIRVIKALDLLEKAEWGVGHVDTHVPAKTAYSNYAHRGHDCLLVDGSKALQAAKHALAMAKVAAEQAGFEVKPDKRCKFDYKMTFVGNPKPAAVVLSPGQAAKAGQEYVLASTLQMASQQHQLAAA